MAERRELGAAFRVVSAAALLVLLAVHAGGKIERGVAPEMLWACHVATAVAVVGLLAKELEVVVAAGVFHGAVGLPAYALDVLLTGETTWTSLLLHLGTPAVGIAAAREVGVPWWTTLAGAVFFLALLPVSRLTPEALNVNMAWRPYDVWPDGTPLALFLAVTLVEVVLQLAAAQWLLFKAVTR